MIPSQTYTFSRTSLPKYSICRRTDPITLMPWWLAVIMRIRSSVSMSKMRHSFARSTCMSDCVAPVSNIAKTSVVGQDVLKSVGGGTPTCFTLTYVSGVARGLFITGRPYLSLSYALWEEIIATSFESMLPKILLTNPSGIWSVISFVVSSSSMAFNMPGLRTRCPYRSMKILWSPLKWVLQFQNGVILHFLHLRSNVALVRYACWPLGNAGGCVGRLW